MSVFHVEMPADHLRLKIEKHQTIRHNDFSSALSGTIEPIRSVMISASLEIMFENFPARKRDDVMNPPIDLKPGIILSGH